MGYKGAGSIHHYIPFRAWLYQRRQDATPIGNIARAIMVDRCLPREDVRQISGYMRHFQQVHGATTEDLAALGMAWASYQQYKFEVQSR